jgi:hypothetical protein
MTVWGVGAGGSGAVGAGGSGWTAVVLTATVVEETVAYMVYMFPNLQCYSSCPFS